MTSNQRLHRSLRNLVMALLAVSIGGRFALAQTAAPAKTNEKASAPSSPASTQAEKSTAKDSTGNQPAESRPTTTVVALPKADGKQAELTDPKIGTDWVRIRYDDKLKDKPLAMQTAVVRYAGQTGTGATRHDVTVDLIGAVHVGDIAYYDELNKLFTQYDALLYELVAPPGTVVPKGRGSSNLHAVGALQNGMKTMLELDHQLVQVDYTKPNFVHADMSPDQFEKAMADRNEGWLQMYFRLLGTALAQQGEMQANAPSDLDIISALFAKDRPRRLKILLGKQLSEMESLMVSFGGEDGSAIITDRNKMALKVLRDQMTSGKKQLGIFYGAGHLQDMDGRLRKEFELKPVSITWLTAWKLSD